MKKVRDLCFIWMRFKKFGLVVDVGKRWVFVGKISLNKIIEIDFLSGCGFFV